VRLAGKNNTAKYSMKTKPKKDLHNTPENSSNSKTNTTTGK
jgi:hypothetical protein